MNLNVPLSSEEIIARLGGSFLLSVGNRQSATPVNAEFVSSTLHDEIVKHCLEDSATLLARYVLQLRKEGKMQFFDENPLILYNRLARDYAPPACKYEAFRLALYRNR